MVYYDSINVGAEIEFMKNEKICAGVVRYKGGVVSREGDWIGIEANEPVGDNDGRVLGRRYFQCKDLHGIFLTASELRFMRRGMKKTNNPYKVTQAKSECDDILFDTNKYNFICYSCITKEYLERAKTAFEPVYYSYCGPEARHVTHCSILKEQKKAEPPKPKMVPKKADNELFHSVSSIPKTHIPDDELRILAKSWPKNVSLTRYSNLNNTYDSLNKQLWNKV